MAGGPTSLGVPGISLDMVVSCVGSYTSPMSPFLSVFESFLESRRKRNPSWSHKKRLFEPLAGANRRERFTELGVPRIPSE